MATDALQVDVVRVFCDPRGDHGNPLGVILDGAACPERAERQEIAFELGFSETVFIDDAARGALQIFTPEHELAFAGHPLVGTAWLLAHRGTPVSTLHPPAGAVPCGLADHGAWIVADPDPGPAWILRELADADAVDAIDADGLPADTLQYAWAWLDEARGIVRARCFVKEHGIVEDEATGSAALRLCGQLLRPIEIHQGRGSRLSAEPADGGRAKVEGRVVFDETVSLAR